MTGLPATGKSAIADAIGRALPAPVFSVDPLEATLNRAGITREHRSGHAAYDLAAMLAEAQLRAGQSAVVDAVNGLRLRAHVVDRHRRARTSRAAHHHRDHLFRPRATPPAARTPDVATIDGFLYDVTWAEVEASMAEYEPPTDADLVLDAVDPLDANIRRALDCIANVIGDTE